MILKTTLLLLLAAAPVLQAQQAPAPAAPTAAAKPTTAPAAVTDPALMSPDQLRTQLARDEGRLKDWPALGRYRDANAKLPAPQPNENRVVFMGDSITDFWARYADLFFPGKPYVGRGISGQTTPQMLIRFRPDVIALHPKVVVILAGTNDISGNTGPESDTDIENNFASMGDLARQNDIRVVISSILPVCGAVTVKRPTERILLLNDWLKSYAAANNFTYLDYYPALLDDETNEFRKSLTGDCLHPNAEGYKVMAPLAEEAIQKALAKPLSDEAVKKPTQPKK
jgi:lysophospholipase L1-like esterase